MNKTKPFCIPKTSVMAAWESVKANRGASGIDEQSIQDFELKLKDNLYKLWNRLSSGSYFPPPVKLVEIAKPGGGVRRLGIPTVADRIAQTVVKDYLEPKLDPIFHEDSYGYRPGKSALDAVGQARQRCWRQDWCVDIDIEGFFDNLDHELVLKALRFHEEEKWILLYVERWLKAPIQDKEGRLIERTSGTPQGGVISPLLANLMMHYAFDNWMSRHCPNVKFERYADDLVVHCSTLAQAEEVLEAIRVRLQECGLKLHPVKTKIVYCKDSLRKGSYEHKSFDFLGFTFRPRLSKSKYGKLFVNFSPAISARAAKRLRRVIRSWKIARRSNKSLTDLARMVNVKVQGWVNYYGRFYRSGLYPVLRQLEQALMRWVMRKYKRYRRRKSRAAQWLAEVRKREPGLFVHWRLGCGC